MDVETLFFVEASLLFLFGLTMIVNSASQNTSQCSDYWFAASNITGAAGLLLHALFPHPLLFTVLVPNVLLYIELSLLNKAIAEFVQRARSLWLGFLALSAAMTAVSLYIVFHHLNPDLITYYISVITISTAMASAILLFRFGGSGTNTASRIMGTLFSLYALNNVARMLDAPHHLRLRFYHLWFDRTIIAVLSFGYILMTAARLRNKLEQQANTDPLTGTLNRRAVERDTLRLVARQQQRPHYISVLMLDLDNFKKINDQFGHHAGDLALRALADALRQTMRTGDLIGRLGGDEFLVVMSGTGAHEADIAADRVRKHLAGLWIETDTGSFGIQASIGVISVDSQNLRIEDLMKLGDQALYAAKQERHNNAVEAWVPEAAEVIRELQASR